MTTLLKLGIQGIRAFDHEHLERLDFEKPVTLIVGHNGAGKTTIIECLKMAASGSLPPNSSSGHSFIHDPKVAQLPEVKAQIRMLFQTQKNHEICVIRSFELLNTTVKGVLKPKFRAIDSVLKTTTADGDKTSLSSKCADTDMEVLRLMGVSKAMIENVIFCHQEDSNWPLAEMRVLKKRFDDIFGAARYTKALEAIAKLLREQRANVKERKADVDVLSTHSGIVNKLREQGRQHENQIENFRERLTEAQKQHSTDLPELQRLEQDAQRSQEVASQITHFEALAERVKQDANRILSTIEKGSLYNEPLEELKQHLLAFHNERIPQGKQAAEQAREHVTQAEQAHELAANKEKQLRLDVGDLAGGADTLTALRRQMNERFTRAQNLHGSTILTEVSRSSADGGAGVLEQLFNSKQGDVNQKRESMKATMLQANANIRNMESSLQQLQGEVSTCDAQASQCRQNIQKLQQEVLQLQDAQRQLEVVKQEIGSQSLDDMQKQEIQTNNKVQQLEQQINDLRNKRSLMQGQIEQGQQNLRQLELQSEALLELDVLRKRRVEQQGLVDNISSTLSPTLMTVIGECPAANLVGSKIQDALRVSQQELNSNRKQLEEANRR